MVEGEVRFKGQDLRKYSEEQMRQLRGDRIAMIFQDPLMTLNPVLRIGEQMMEAILTHADVPRAQALELPRSAGDGGHPSPEKRLKSYPHEFSGGMRQRVAIAIAMLNKPDLIICDEPTTALLDSMPPHPALIWITHAWRGRRACPAVLGCAFRRAAPARSRAAPSKPPPSPPKARAVTADVPIAREAEQA